MLNCEISNIVIYLGKWVEFFSKKCWGSHVAFLALWWPKWQIKIYDEETPQSQVKKPKKVFSFLLVAESFFYDTYILFSQKIRILQKFTNVILWFQVFTRRFKFLLLPIIHLEFSKSEFSFSDFILLLYLIFIVYSLDKIYKRPWT